MGPSVLASTSPAASLPRDSHVGLDVLELWVSDLSRTARFLSASFGFERFDAQLSCGRAEKLACLACGGVTLVLRQGASSTSPIARHVAVHGDTVGDVALICGDEGSILDRAVAHGLQVTGGDVRRIDVTGDGTICHSIRESSLVAPPRQLGKPRMLGVDHVTYCLSAGMTQRVAEVYEAVFGLERLDVGDCQAVGGDVAGMRSVVLRSRSGFTVVLTEAVNAQGQGQTQRFVTAHRGPGVQHAAVAYDDLCAAVASLRSTGVRFLRAPAEYYERSQRRLADRALAWDALRRLEILVDADDDGLLFQLFTQPITDRGTFFIELIQRSGASGFGANNVRALFAAVDAAAHAGPADSAVDG